MPEFPNLKVSRNINRYGIIQNNTEVIIKGLVNASNYNNCKGIIRNYDLHKKRYIISVNGNDILLKCDNFIYWVESKKIAAYDNAMVKDSMRTLSGDSISLNYDNSKIHEIKIIDNVIVLSKKNIKLSEGSTYQSVNDAIWLFYHISLVFIF